MAQHVHDPAVIERRLRPIYDSLEVGNNKKALQEAEKVLKKNPTIQCARALKALALLRIGKEEDAQSLITQIAEEKPCDDPTLQVMTFCYKEQDQLDKICTLYTNAAKQVPGNEEILSHLFMSHVRVNDFQSQQTVALQLYKLKPKNPYYFWAVMSIVLKAVRGVDSKDPKKSKLLLALAQRMIDKQIAENKLDAEQEVQLYLTILRYQDKHQEALDFLEGDLGRSLYPGAPITLKIDLLKSLKKWPQLNILMKDLLRENHDRWDYYKEYILTVVELKKLCESTEVEQFCFKHCNDFLCGIIESGGKKVRGPYLGRLELHRVMTEHNHNATEILGDMLELLVEYFRLFGDKPCCANDIILFLDSLNTFSRAGLAARLLQVCEISSTTLPQSKEQMQKHICSLQISRICGAHSLSAEHLAALYTAFSLHYEHGLTAFGSDHLPTDMGPSDSYALLAVQVMYDLAVKTKSSEPLVEALCLLHYLLSNSPSNFHAKLLCLQIYHILGCGWGAHKTYESLDIKHVQLDSMGYLHCAQLPIVGIASIAKPLYDSTLKFFTTSYKDSLEYLAMCYKFGSFSKLEEFMDFRERLSNSLHYSLISAEALLIELVCMCGSFSQNMITIKGMNIEPFEDRILWGALMDNRDLSVIVRWDPNPNEPYLTKEEEEVDDIATESFKQDVELLRLRATVLRIIGACVEAVTKDTELRTIETLALLKKSWEELFLRIHQMMYKPTSNRFLVNLLPSRLHGILSMPYEKFFHNLILLIMALVQSSGCPDTIAKLLDDNVNEVSQLLCTSIKEHNQTMDSMWNRRLIQEIVVNCIEILSLYTLVLSVCFEKFSNLTTTKQNKKGKKKDNQNSCNLTNILSDKDRLQIITSLGTKLKIEIQNCDEALDTWKTPRVSENITDRIAAMSLNPKVEILVNGTLKDSHNITVKEIKLILKEKNRMINSMISYKT